MSESSCAIIDSCARGRFTHSCRHSVQDATESRARSGMHSSCARQYGVRSPTKPTSEIPKVDAGLFSLGGSSLPRVFETFVTTVRRRAPEWGLIRSCYGTLIPILCPDAFARGGRVVFDFNIPATAPLALTACARSWKGTPMYSARTPCGSGSSRYRLYR